MERGQPFIRLKLDVHDAIELTQFVGAFTALASEYDRFMRAERPNENPDATLFVKEVREGCIEADLITWGALAVGAVVAVSGATVATAAGFNVLDEFVERVGNRIRTYTKPGGRLKETSKGELNDFLDQVAAVAALPGSALHVASMEIENGDAKVRVGFHFDTNEARQIQQRVEEHKLEIAHTSRADHERVLMTFVRSDIRVAALGKRSGELVKIERISDKPRPLIYVSDLAEQQIKHEITNDDSVYKKGFVVDVNVELRGGRPVAYAVTNLHSWMDLPDDEEG
jgi:hypothetical protein